MLDSDVRRVEFQVLDRVAQHARATAVRIPARGAGRRLDPRRHPPGDRLQQPAARPSTGLPCERRWEATAARDRSRPSPSRDARRGWRRHGFPRPCWRASWRWAGALYWLRLRQVRARFGVVLEERARISRELHDTLAQDFVGISSQLNGVASVLRESPAVAEERLALARRMTQHSLTEARRSIMDLRMSALEGRDLPSAIEHVAKTITAGSGVAVSVDGDAARHRARHRPAAALRAHRPGGDRQRGEAWPAIDHQCHPVAPTATRC